MNTVSNAFNYLVDTATNCYADYTAEECQDLLPSASSVLNTVKRMQEYSLSGAQSMVNMMAAIAIIGAIATIGLFCLNRQHINERVQSPEFQEALGEENQRLARDRAAQENDMAEIRRLDEEQQRIVREFMQREGL